MARCSSYRVLFHLMSLACVCVILPMVLYTTRQITAHDMRAKYRAGQTQQWNRSHLDHRFSQHGETSVHQMNQKATTQGLLVTTMEQPSISAEESRLSNITMFLRPYMQELERLRKDMLSHRALSEWPDLPNSRANRLFGYESTFFKKLSKHPHIKVLQITARDNDLTTLVLDEYYDYSSNDCSTVETNSKGTSGMIQALYNASCTDNIAQIHTSAQPLSNRRSSLDVFMPYGYQAPPGEHTLSYILLVAQAVVDNNGDVISDVTVVPRRCRDTYVYDYLDDITVQDIPHYEEVFTIHQFFGREFYHSSVEDLHRLAPYVEFLSLNPSIKLHVGYEHPFLALLGMDRSRLVMGRVAARLVYLPAGGLCGTSPVFATQLLSLHLRQSVPRPVIQDTVVLIQRSTHKQRHFKHHTPILDMLRMESQARGLRVEVFSDSPLPSLSQTVSMFSRAAVVVSPHGAGAVNLLFSTPGTLLLEGLTPGPKGFPNVCFISLAQALGLRYHGMFYDKGVTEYTAQDIQEPFVRLLQTLR